VTRPQLFADVPVWIFQTDTPIWCSIGGSLVAYYARDEIYRSSWDTHAVKMAIRVTEYLVMACKRWYK